MKYWKGQAGTPKAGQYGIRDDDGYVPGSNECTQSEYQVWVDSLPITPVVKSPLEKLIAWAKTKGYDDSK